MTREQVAALFERRRRALESKDVDTLTTFYAEDCIVESPTAGIIRGRAAVEGVNETWFENAFPDLVVTVDDVVIDGNRVAEVLTFAGTDTGMFMGMPPTKKSFKVPMVLLIQLNEAGEIVHEQRIYDFTGLLVQIGVLKTRPL